MNFPVHVCSYISVILIGHCLSVTVLVIMWCYCYYVHGSLIPCSSGRSPLPVSGLGWGYVLVACNNVKCTSNTSYITDIHTPPTHMQWQWIILDTSHTVILTSTFQDSEHSSVCNNINIITGLTNVLASLVDTNVTYLQDWLSEIKTRVERQWSVDGVLKKMSK